MTGGIQLPLELLLLSLIVFGSLGIVLTRCLQRNLRLAAVVIGLTIVHEALFVGYPLWFAVWSNFRLERELLTAVGSEQLAMVALGEAIFCLLFCLAFAAVGQRAAIADSSRELDGERDLAGERTLLVLVIAGLVVYGQIAVTPAVPFEEMELIVRPEAGITAQVAGWLNSLFHFTPLVAAALLLIGPSARGGPRARIGQYLAVALLLLVVYVGLLSGARGRITWVGSVLLVSALLRGSWRGVALAFVIAVASAPLVLALGPETRAVMVQATAAGVRRIDVVRLVLQVAREDRSAISDASPLAQLAGRAEGPRNAVALYRLHDEMGGPGLGVYLGSVLFPLPRRIWGEKSAPGSPTSDFYGAAMYQSKALSYGAVNEMGPVLASAHAYWEGGWLAVAIAGILTGLFWGILLRWSTRVPAPLKPVIVLAFAASFLVDGFLTAFCPIWSFILTGWRWIVPVLGIYFSILTMTRLGKQMRTPRALGESTHK